MLAFCLFSPLCNSVTDLQRASEGGRRPSRVAKCMYTKTIVSKCLIASCHLNSLKEKTLIQCLFHSCLCRSRAVAITE